jgi:hypothetical protein
MVRFFQLHLIFSLIEVTDVVRALSRAISFIQQGTHSPLKAHERVKDFYSWAQIAERTEKVYMAVLSTPPRDLWERMQRCDLSLSLHLTTENDDSRPTEPLVWAHIQDSCIVSSSSWIAFFICS